MPTEEIIHLPLGRVAVIERQRTARGKAERVAFLDEVPLRVARAETSEARVAVVEENRHRHLRWLAFGGRLYRPLWPDWQTGVGTVDAIAEQIARDARSYARDPHPPNRYGEILQDLAPLRVGYTGERGIGPDGHHPVRRWIEDGRAQQSREAAAIAARLLIVDGGLYHSAPVPGWRVHHATGTSQEAGPGGVPGTATTVEASWWKPYENRRDAGAPRDERNGDDHWATFPPDGRNEADAVARHLAATVPGGRLGPSHAQQLAAMSYTVVDPAALASALPRGGADEWLARAGRSFLDAAAPALPGMPTEAVEAFLAARRAVDDVAGHGGHEAAYGPVRRFAGMLVERHADVEAVPPGAVAARCLTYRYEQFERHRTPASAPEPTDEAALAGLGR